MVTKSMLQSTASPVLLLTSSKGNEEPLKVSILERLQDILNRESALDLLELLQDRRVKLKYRHLFLLKQAKVKAPSWEYDGDEVLKALIAEELATLVENA